MTTEPLEPPQTDDPKKLQKWAGTKLSLSLAVSVYLRPSDVDSVEGALACYRQYLDLCGPQLTWFADETGKKYREATPDVLRIPFDRAPEARDSGKFYSWGAFAGKHHRHAAPSQFRIHLSPNEDGYGLSWVRAAFSVDLFRDDLDRFVAVAKRLTAPLPVFHGMGGFSFSESMVSGERQTNEPYLIAAAMHFAGVEVEADGMSSHCCGNAIKGANWLTMLDASLVKRLGGEKTLRTHLSEAITVHRMPWGVMIQAGPEPSLGAVNMGETLPLYREVNKALRSLRVAVHWNLGVQFDEARTRRWIGRFD